MWCKCLKTLQVLKGRDENRSKNGRQPGRWKVQPVDVDHEKCSLVNVNGTFSWSTAGCNFHHTLLKCHFLDTNIEQSVTHLHQKKILPTTTSFTTPARRAGIYFLSPETVHKCTTNDYAHSVLAQKRKYFLAGLFPGFLSGRALGSW